MSEPRFLVRLPSERAQVAHVAARWKVTYFNAGAWDTYYPVYEQLAALPADATAQDVAAIIGNDTWIGDRCDGCHTTTCDAWQIGEEPDYESHTVVLCDACMAALVEAVGRTR